jgi:hypothetical protein
MRQEKVWFVISGILTVLAVALMRPTGAAAASKYKVLHKCDRGSAILPEAGLIFDKAGNLYGTTAAGCGDVFKLRPNSNGSWTFIVLHEFSCGDGAEPFAPLIFDKAGLLDFR